ncbi:hypothetical protein [Niabella ginsengisoli]|uniref:Monooxygenase n=1 Tax=Niabella ginsengisoli TaxID=522298 RepID=A0ABS9SML8_9BACT|nr:hypothetical protein [Niabella ginsengisoli]MCH5599511.1 hypothetical protein [Niabella ginsengisoli]
MSADFVVLATGYEYRVPAFLNPLKQINYNDHRQFKVNRNYSIDDRNRIFVQNAEMHTHGFNAPDLGLGAYRNAVIINTILGYAYYPVDTKIAFQQFGIAG